MQQSSYGPLIVYKPQNTEHLCAFNSYIHFDYIATTIGPSTILVVQH
jgi:hypothetical protein